MKAEVRFHPEAAEEVEQAASWYAERSRTASRAFIAEFGLVLDRVADSPDGYPAYEFGTRRLLFPHFPFSLVYRERENQIEVIAVAHHRRRPFYWRSRRSRRRPAR